MISDTPDRRFSAQFWNHCDSTILGGPLVVALWGLHAAFSFSMHICLLGFLFPFDLYLLSLFPVFGLWLLSLGRGRLNAAVQQDVGGRLKTRSNSSSNFPWEMSWQQTGQAHMVQVMLGFFDIRII